MKILTLDIETTPHGTWNFGLFNQNIGLVQIDIPTRVLCFAAKWKGDREVLFFRSDGTPEQQHIMAAEAWKLLDEADAVITYNGDRFDLPHLNREFLLAGLGEPAPYASIDLLKTIRRRFRFASNKLDWISQQLGVGHKTHHTGFQLWLDCMAGDEKAWKLMTRYNKGDVRITEKDYIKILPWIQNHPNVALIAGVGDLVVCPTCISSKVHKRGFAHTALSTFQRYNCGNCGKWFRGTKRIDGSGYR